jgi:hypothetical protein
MAGPLDPFAPPINSTPLGSTRPIQGNPGVPEGLGTPKPKPSKE